MHPVIKSILARRGKTVPVADGRKITLILFGGLMTGIRGGGALMALDDLGLRHAFDEIYTTSGGFPNASCFLCGDGERGASIYYDDFAGRKFIKFYKPWNIMDVNYLLDVVRRKKPLNLPALWTSSTKLFIRLLNTKTKKIEYPELHSFKPEEFEKILKAAVSIAYFQPGSVQIRDQWYKDGGARRSDSRDHVARALRTDATDILIIYSRPQQKLCHFPDEDRVCKIFPEPGFFLSRFETNREKLLFSYRQMRERVHKIFSEH